ncbi:MULTISPECIES: helix-turn-helix domain-containing protein [unclassified Lysobacter]|uniref:helix-turn-helix transcriptional regulator n=1 Tax=unclassified Lysobacter TaxID=2635362 RepID=UPI001BE9E905|nr:MULTISPECIES: helix-turn-helix domain-containing protein [unclassified Lysobacter]MBT2748288.1 helix-turn-helix domain-containing protein [Lysobacter sp. ISL-42]MBT2749945.1 helix-turn-helix domain-containing protein [Lysobacter sp. ISL-50]MBT2781273.1 helix-turn-helix domain-containing protein [Lysobacter sp. ISL-52]
MQSLTTRRQALERQTELSLLFWAAPDAAMLDRRTAAAGLGYTVAWLEAVAARGAGPAYTRIGRRVRYRKADVLAWLARHGERVTPSDEGAR